MNPLTQVYLYLLGLASGLAVLAISAYRRVTPLWLRWLLIASGLLVIGRYATLALFTSPDAPQRFWALRRCYFLSAIGPTLPSVFAVDQLLRHPGMSPKKLLGWFAPFLVGYGFIILCGDVTPAADPVVGWTLHLTTPWRVAAAVIQGGFVVGFIGICVLLMRKVPSRPIRIALLGLALGHGYLALDGLLLSFGAWYFRPFLYSEMVTLLAIWHAYETAWSLQQAS